MSFAATEFDWEKTRLYLKSQQSILDRVIDAIERINKDHDVDDAQYASDELNVVLDVARLLPSDADMLNRLCLELDPKHRPMPPFRAGMYGDEAHRAVLASMEVVQSCLDPNPDREKDEIAIPRSTRQIRNHGTPRKRRNAKRRITKAS